MQIANLICLDTSAGGCDVALFVERALICESKYAGNKAGEISVAAIQSVTTAHGISLKDCPNFVLAISQGPGSYTGLRVGGSVASGLAAALGLRVLSIPALLSRAYIELQPGKTNLIRLRANKNEYYWQLVKLEVSELEVLSAIQLSAVSELDRDVKDFVGERFGSFEVTDITEQTSNLAVSMGRFLIDNGVSHAVTWEGFTPSQLFYGKSVNAPTLAERGISSC